MPVADVGELIARCLCGDDQAQALFYAEYVGLVQRAVSRRLSTATASAPLRSEVEDICNEVFARVFADGCRVLGQLRKPRAINAWLTTLARNQTVDYVRKWSSRGFGNGRQTDGLPSDAYASEVREEAVDYTASSEQQVMASERNTAIEQCLASLSAEERLIVELFYQHGLKYVEIAEVVGLNINTVSAKLRRAKMKLRRLLEEEHYELTH